MLAAVVDIVDELALLRGQLPEFDVGQEVGEADHRIERRAQLV